MAILITGGAGYIGSHTARALHEQGEEIVVFDSLQTGHRQAVPAGVPFYQGDLREAGALEPVFENHSISAVVHFAAFSLVGESVTEPLKYYNNNVHGTECLLTALRDHGVKAIVFSSTAATYGEPENIPILETDRTLPTNPYGETKLAIEKMLRWCDRAYGIKSVALRYFNAAGAHKSGEIGEDHRPETHLIPNVLRAALTGKPVKLFGTDYPTKDGTCVRDYIHVTDLAQAHILALRHLLGGGDSTVYNLGSGTGFSVREIVDAAEAVTGKTIAREYCSRRAGDPATLIASSEKIRRELGWKPQFDDIHAIIETAWRFLESHPNGYGDGE